MSYLEEAKTEIRERWFENHTIKKIEGEEGFQRIVWGEEGTRMYQVEYVLSGNMVFISGDLGDAVYSLTCPATLDNLGKFDLSYFTGKLTAHQREKYNFNDTLARKQIREYFLDWCDVESISELKSDDKELYDQLITETHQWSKCDHFSTGVYSVYQLTQVEWFESESATCIADCGNQLSHSIISYWLGLKMIFEQLKAKEEVITS